MTFWQRKLLAFLHDPPSKAFDIANHKEVAHALTLAAMATDEEASKWADHTPDHLAAAADRFPFPGSSSGLRSKFRGDRETPFKHPLGGGALWYERPLPSAAAVEEVFQQTHPVGQAGGLPPEHQEWASFFLHWRRWPEEAARHDGRTAHLPADTRLPDHTIWNHLAVVSAVEGCREAEGKPLRPAFLLLQLGPVQEFIAQARSTRDLWAGSYLLSWLMAHALKAVTDAVGPDTVIFPSLRGQPIYDALHRAELYDQVTYAHGEGRQQTLWQRLGLSAAALTTPSLPNRFLALVPEARGEALAQAAAIAIQTELGRIADACWAWLERETGDLLQPGDRQRWDEQVARFAQVTWYVQPWTERPAKEMLDLFAQLPGGGDGAAANLTLLHDLATQGIPQGHRDPRFYEDPASKQVLNNRGFWWPVYYALADLGLAARRNTRDFTAWGTDDFLAGAPKDALTGKEEVIGSEAFAKCLHDREDKLFKATGHRYGAMTLIKRVWRETDYLPQTLGLKREQFRNATAFASVPEIAAVGREPDDDVPEGSGYYAVLALDGDEMGKWVSGAKTPPFSEQLSGGAKAYFDNLAEPKSAVGKALQARRSLSPSYHLQFSEALSNFSLHLAEPIVELHGGQLIYSGGDDVLAMLPAAQALPCAAMLRAAFRGDDPERLLANLSGEIRAEGGFVHGAAEYPLIVPGKNAEVSCGIAIAHVREPLQMVVRAAQDAEKRAKQELGRAAFAVTLYKRGGETVEWGAKWDGGALALAEEFRRLCYEEGKLSKRFPYALAALLRPYYERDKHRRVTTRAGDEPQGLVLRDAVAKEFAHVLDRQCQDTRWWHEASADFTGKVMAYYDHLAEQRRPLDDFEKLFLTVAFMNRQEGE